ncbi:MAG: helix-turn-helix domain-containing protein [Bacillota bacterium]
MNNLHIILGQRIRVARNEQKFTREKLAEKINVSPRFLAEVESGKVGVSIVTLQNICNTLDVSSDYLLGLNDTKAEQIDILLKQLLKVEKKYYPLIASMLDHLTSI